MKKLLVWFLILLMTIGTNALSFAEITINPVEPIPGDAIVVNLKSNISSGTKANVTWYLKKDDGEKVEIAKQSDIVKTEVGDEAYYVSVLNLSNLESGEYVIYAVINTSNKNGPIPVGDEESYSIVIQETTVYDTTSPVITAPSDMVVEATGPQGAIVEFVVSAYDENDGNLSLESNFVSGDIFPLGITTVTLKAVDAAGNSGYGSFQINVVDTTKPELTVPEDIVIEAEGPNGARVDYEIIATDSVDLDVTLNSSPISGSVFPLGKTSVEVEAVDDSGNAVQKTFNVTVVDTTPPSLGVIEDIVVYSQNDQGAIVNFETSAFDLVDGDIQVKYSHVSGSYFNVGTTQVTYSATDSRGNAISKKFNIIVKYDFSGFFRPIDSDSEVVNVVKAGSSIPIKFSLNGYQGTNVFAVGYPMVITGVYQPDVEYEVITTIETAGKSGLNYDSYSDQYTYVWQTNKAWAGSNKILVVKFSDGTYKTVNFQFKK